MTDNGNKRESEVRVRADRPKDASFKGFVVRSAQGHGIPTAAAKEIQQAVSADLSRFGMTSLRPSK